LAAIEYVDEKVRGVVVKGLEEAGEDFRILLLPDHPTPIEARTHTSEPVPYLLYDSTRRMEGAASYDEETAAASGRNWPEGYKLIGHLIQEELCW
ncbi:MAG: phosphoglycerate mutase, partial [Lachnospiraceae bacterium]|nr:phosphoglycerate mutase [Lachnospiraceae bacterium]